MKAYLDLLNHVLVNGRDRSDRTGVGTRSVFGAQMRMDLQEGFPLLTTKKVHFKSIATELLWFLRGDTNIKFLHEHGVTIWDEWADENGNLGPVYGAQWRFWMDHRKAVAPITDEALDTPNAFAPVTFGTIDQIDQLIRDIVSKPDSRRHIVTAWNPSDVPFMALPPCHTMWQCYCRPLPDGWRETVQKAGMLDLHLYARSIDIFLGLPFNIASYALLTRLLARATGRLPGDLVISFGDLHLYSNHFDQAREQLSREPRPLPNVQISPDAPLDFQKIKPTDLILEDYDPHPAIKAPIAV